MGDFYANYLSKNIDEDGIQIRALMNLFFKNLIIETAEGEKKRPIYSDLGLSLRIRKKILEYKRTKAIIKGVRV